VKYLAFSLAKWYTRPRIYLKSPEITMSPREQSAKQEKSQFAQFEEEIVEFWEENKCFEKSVEMRSEDKQYVFYDGPPFATGLPHYGHMLASTVKDSVPRFWTMRGYRVERRWGWDCHGLPIENLIEKELGLNSRKEIEEYGIDKFNDKCRSAILMYDAEWQKFVKRIGRWVDMDNSYKTMDNSYMESVWWAFSELHKKDLVYEGRRVSLYCPRCETPLSNFEIAMDDSYKDVADPSVVWKFPLVEDEKTSLLAWTTTPWSTPGTTGLSIGPDFDYVKVKVGDEFIVFAKERMDFVLGHLDEKDWEIVEEMKGSAWVGKEYVPIMDSYTELVEVKENENTYKVFAGDYVEVEDGTGIVTINGTYGEVDMEAAKNNGLPLVFDVNNEGKYNEVAGPYAGMYIKDAEKPLIKDMKEAGRIWRTESYTHSYPHCWRCETPLYYFAGPAWFINVQKIKPDMLEQNEAINWHPEHLKKGRFGKGLETAPDWNISRSRFWGTAMPIWKCSKDHVTIIGSVAELSEKSGRDLTELDLHRPHIDGVTFDCDECGEVMTRIPDVFDTWVDSGSMPFAEKHYPFEHTEEFKKFYPAEFISEYIAQTRGWFYTLHVLSTALFGKPSFTNAVTTGTLMAEDGQKLSKSKKNFTPPELMFDKYSVDAVRFYLLSSAIMDGAKVNFSDRDVDKIQKKYINTLWNVYTFYTMFAEQEKAEITEVATEEVSHVMDKWILAKLSLFVKEVTDAYESYTIRKTAAPLQDFVQEVSTWYVRRSRDRFKGEDDEDRVMALRTLYTVLKTLMKIGAPVTPFITEKIYKEIKLADDPFSVHHCDWPEVGNADQKVLDEMTAARDAIEKALALRAEAKMKVRQPLQSMTFKTKIVDELLDTVRDELNVREVLFGDEDMLDVEMTEELRVEGALRELIRQTNSLRKKAKLTINDQISVKIQTDGADVQAVLEKHKDEYLKSVLGKAVELISEVQEHELDVNGDTVTLSF